MTGKRRHVAAVVCLLAGALARAGLRPRPEHAVRCAGAFDTVAVGAGGGDDVVRPLARAGGGLEG